MSGQRARVSPPPSTENPSSSRAWFLFLRSLAWEGSRILTSISGNFARGSRPAGNRLNNYLLHSYTQTFLLTDVQIWSKIRPVLKRASSRIVLGLGPLPVSIPLSSVHGSVGPHRHGQKES